MSYQVVRVDKKKSKSGGETHGWQVRVGENLKAGYHSKFFSDSKYGGKDAALASAKEYMREYLKRNPEYNFQMKPPRWKRGFNEYGTLNSRNKSGRNGVCRSREHFRHDKSRYRYFWAASYTIDRFGKTGVKRNKKFYVDQYGEEGAKQLAIEFREMWEKAALKGVEAVKEFFETYSETP